MNLILLTILIGIVPVESSSDYKVNNGYCEYSEFILQSFEEITNSSLRSFLLHFLGEIENNDCVRSFQVKMNDDENPFYVFRIDRQMKSLRTFIQCGVATVDAEGSFKWNTCDAAKFNKYLEKCEREVKPEARQLLVPPVLSCNQTLDLPPRPIPAHKVTPPTPDPRNLTYTTPEGLLSRLLQMFYTSLLAPKYILIHY